MQDRGFLVLLGIVSDTFPPLKSHWPLLLHFLCHCVVVSGPEPTMLQAVLFTDRVLFFLTV